MFWNSSTIQSSKPEYNLVFNGTFRLSLSKSPNRSYLICEKTWWLEQAKIYIYWNLIIKIQMRVWCVEKEMFTGVLMWSVLAIFSGLCVLTLLIDCLFLIIIHSVTVWHENININMIQNVHPRFLVGFELFNGAFLCSDLYIIVILSDYHFWYSTIIRVLSN